MASCIDDHADASRHRCAADSGNVGGGVSLPNANCIGLASNTAVGDVYIVIAGGQVKACISAQSHVATTDYVALQRIVTYGGVLVAVCVAKEGLKTDGRIEITPSVFKQRLSTDPGILAAEIVC